MNAPSEWNADLNPVISALQRGHYLLYCQQIQPLTASCRTSVINEILVRLFEEERHLLPPGMFFPMLQEQGLISLLDCWVVNQVLKLQDAAIKADPGWQIPCNSVNLSEDSVLDPEFVTFVNNQLNKWQPVEGTLCFEVLSTIAVDDAEAIGSLIDALAPRGCSFAFGGCTGAAEELDVIDRLPFRFVKIDGSLVRKLLVSRAHQSRVASIHSRCQARGIETIAEFVEDDDTKALLVKLGVQYAQGFGIAEPVPFLAEF